MSLPNTPSVPLVDNLSLWSLLGQADWAIKGVVTILVGASIWSWAFSLWKWTEMKRLKHFVTLIDENFDRKTSIDNLFVFFRTHNTVPPSGIFFLAFQEIQKVGLSFLQRHTAESRSFFQKKIQKKMEISIAKELNRCRKSLNFLASIGSTAPFVGLFGTVWGILRSFQALPSHGATLSVVAPAISEALFATAFGLVVAIPAVMFYNKLIQDVEDYEETLHILTHEFLNIIEQQLSDV